MIPALRLEKMRDGQVTTYPFPRIVTSGRCDRCSHVTVSPEDFRSGEIVSWRAGELDPSSYQPTPVPPTFRHRGGP